jgi:hypothetical protein
VRKVTFCRNKGNGFSTIKETIEVEENATEEEINEMYVEWILNEVEEEFWIEED